MVRTLAREKQPEISNYLPIKNKLKKTTYNSRGNLEKEKQS